MKIILSHPTGNSNVRAILSALVEANCLLEFNTTLSVNDQAAWVKLLPSGIRQELLRRKFPVSSEYISTHCYLEVLRMAFLRLGLNNWIRNEHGLASVDSVYRSFDQAVARRIDYLNKGKHIDAVYAYEDGALAVFKKARSLGLKCIYDLPIAYWETSRALMLKEAERLPLWADTLQGGITDSPSKLERKTMELELADIVIVPGQFVLDSLPEFAMKKHIVAVPFGSPSITRKQSRLEKSGHKMRKLKVLFVGSMSQRKGLGDLFAAIKLLNRSDIELVIMGSLLAPMRFYKSELKSFTYEVGRSNEDVLALMRSCDVLCLPSIVEGRALVMQEAMSQGLPLIITANTGGADLIKEGVTGFLVPISSPEIIAEKLAWFLENRSRIPDMGIQAQQHSSTYTWANYGSQIIDSISSYLN